MSITVAGAGETAIYTVWTGKPESEISLKVYGDIRSGNCYKVKLLAAMLDIEHEWKHVDVTSGDTRSESFLAMNPNGKLPMVTLDNGEHLWESNAILYYLADGTSFLPQDGLQRARVLQWLFFEQYSHEPYIAVARFIAKFLGMPESRREEFEAKQDGGHRALGVMDRHLSTWGWLVGDRISVADIALFAYTHVAADGGFDLSGYAAINSWLQRVKDTPGYVAMNERPVD